MTTETNDATVQAPAPTPARKRVRKAPAKRAKAPAKRAKAKAPAKRAKAKKGERKWRSLTEKVVIAGRKELAKRTKAGTAKGYISEFARDHDITNVTAFLALRGRTYRYLPGGVSVAGTILKAKEA
jgi:hypothetical protein